MQKNKTLQLQNTLIIPVIIVISFCLLSIPLLYSPLFSDESAFLYMAKHMSPEKLPYKDIGDNKGPVAYLFFRLITTFFPGNIVASRIAFLFLNLISGILFREIVKHKTDENSANLSMALYFTFHLLPSADLFMTTEPVGMFFLLSSMLCLLSGKTHGYQFAAGIFLAFSLMSNAIFFPALIAFGILHKCKEIQIGGRFLFGAFLGIGIFLIPTIALGIANDFYFWYISYNFEYSSNAFSQESLPLLIFVKIFDFTVWATIAAVLSPFFIKKFKKYKSFIYAFFALSLFGLLRSLGNPWNIDHYDLLALPLWSFGAALLYRESKGFDRIMAKIGFCLLFFLLATAYFQSSQQNLQFFPKTSDMVFADFLKNYTPEIFNSGSLATISGGMFDIEVFYLANSTTPTRFPWVPHSFWGIRHLTEATEHDFLSTINSGKLRYILTESSCLEEKGCISEKIANAINANFTCREMAPPLLPNKNFTYCVRLAK